MLKELMPFKFLGLFFFLGVIVFGECSLDVLERMLTVHRVRGGKEVQRTCRFCAQEFSDKFRLSNHCYKCAF